jgi:hypothetical protein
MAQVWIARARHWRKDRRRIWIFRGIRLMTTIVTFLGDRGALKI